MVWAGDESTDFDLADGLPAALTAALNAGMSGIPLWGSDISGYHYIYNPPPDKELYLRWTELGAFSADMHDENKGAGNEPSSARWQIWDDQETLDTYIKYAGIKTQMLPYVKLAVARSARARAGRSCGICFSITRKTRARGRIADEYMYGDSLLVAPVVDAGATTPQRLPARTRVLRLLDRRARRRRRRRDGAGSARRRAGVRAGRRHHPDARPPTSRPWSLRPTGASFPRATFPAFLAVDVFAGGQTSVQLDDGTVLSQSAPDGSVHAGSAERQQPERSPWSPTQTSCMTCTSCAFDDPAARTRGRSPWRRGRHDHRRTAHAVRLRAHRWSSGLCCECGTDVALESFSRRSR